MTNCCICQFNVRSPKDIYLETVGDPPVLISELVLRCTRGTDYQIPKNTTICKKCTEKLLRYYKASELAKTTRLEILELIHSPYIIEEYKASFKTENEEELEYVIEQIDDDEAVEIKADEDLELIESETLDNVELDNDNNEIIVEIENDDILVEELDDQITEGESVNDDPNYEEHLEIEKYEMEYYDDSRSTADMEHIQSTNDENITCPDCDETFTNKRKFRTHVRREHFPGYVCHQCGKTLHSYSGFIGHLKNHEPVKQFECPVCGERFNRNFRLKHHMAWHSGETPYQCDICSKQFVHKVALYKHKMIHDDGTKRFECNVCKFKFRTRAHLVRHMRSHTGAKPFECPICQKRFSQMYNMKAHQREHSNPGCNRRRRYRCTKCTHSFTNEQNFLDHSARGDCTSANSSVEACNIDL